MTSPDSSDSFSPDVKLKLQALQEKLGTHNLDETLEKSLNIANYIAETVNDPKQRLLVEQQGSYMELKDIA